MLIDQEQVGTQLTQNVAVVELAYDPYPRLGRVLRKGRGKSRHPFYHGDVSPLVRPRLRRADLSLEQGHLPLFPYGPDHAAVEDRPVHGLRLLRGAPAGGALRHGPSEDRLADGPLHAFEDRALVRELHKVLRRMYVDVHPLGGYVDDEDGEGVSTFHQSGSVTPPD